MIIVSLATRFLLLVLYVSDIMLNRKIKKRDNTLKRRLSKSQEFMKFAFHFIVMTGLLLPFNPIYILVTLAVMVFFFIFTDREVYTNLHSMHLRGRYFEFKKIKNFSYENRTLVFDYNDEHIVLKKPFLEETYIQREIVHRIEKAEAKKELKEKRNNRG